MANALAPTAANIISSLGIRGATANENLPGFVPVLDESGKLNAKFIPANSAQLAIPPLSDVVYVDPYTEVEESVRKGSVVAPFKSIAEAARRFVPTEMGAAARQLAFLLAPGDYHDDALISFVSPDSSESESSEQRKTPFGVYFIGLGPCTFGSVLAISGMAESVPGHSQTVVFQNVVCNGTVSISGAPTVACLVGTSIGNLLLGSPSSTVGTVKLAPDSHVGETNATRVLLASASDIANDSDLSGATGTVKDALDRLSARKVRISDISIGSSGLFVVGQNPVDIPVTTINGADVYDLSASHRLLAEGINELFRKGTFEEIEAGKIKATEIVADSATVGKLKIDALTLGGYSLSIDSYGYLVVVDESQPVPGPPEGVILLEDQSNGAVYILGVSNGRMYLQLEDADDESSPDYQRSILVYDSDTGREYEMFVRDGRLMIAEAGSGSDSSPI